MHNKENDANLEATLKSIEEGYAARLPERLAKMQAALEHCRANPADPAMLEALQQHLHTLSGSAGTFGFAQLGTRATELEMLIARFLSQMPLQAQDVLPVLDAVQNMLRQAAAGPDTPPLQTAATEGNATHLVYLVHDNESTAKDIATQLEYFGYAVQVIDDLPKLEAAIEARIPAVVVMDLGFPAGILAGATEAARLRQERGQSFKLIFISTRSNFEARLATVRAGADGYFSKPFDVMTLVDRLDSLMKREEVQSYRILIIDDDVRTSECYALALRNAGMDVQVLNRPQEVLQVLGEYRPELILLDLYMPVCDGIELAHLIRQDNMYLDVPIVFLSDEADFEKQLCAIESGGDDFLVNPIPAHLVAAVSNRAKRYRALRGLIMRDSLTGLLNHSAIKEALMREVSRARRSGAPLALAMIDIDIFKRINDTHGHPVGDQVIRALARLLQQRLRRGDLIGRYGGEEFVVIMPATPLAGAENVLGQIREAFSRIRHYAESNEFTATFSAGIAALTAELDAETMLRQADEALYQAKHDGRNCIRVA